MLCHFKTFDNYVTLHNLSMLLTYIVTLYYYYTMKLYTRDVVIVSYGIADCQLLRGFECTNLKDGISLVSQVSALQEGYLCIW